MEIERSDFGQLPDGSPVDLYRLSNSKGVEAHITNFGGIVVSLKVPDRSGKLEDVVLGYDSLEGYLEESPFFGATIGRFGNRIAKGKFELAGKTYTLARNNGPNHLHGGQKGFHKVLWKAEALKAADSVGLKLYYLSPDGEEGYPGNLRVEVLYTLDNDNAFHIAYKAVTDKATVVNLTHHSYFNLSGNVKKDILDHRLKIEAEQFVPIDETQIPSGELRPVEGTPFDFSEARAIGARINEADEQLKNGLGYDHCWVLKGKKGEMKKAASIFEADSGRYMEVVTSEPGMQFYSGNFLDGTIVGKEGKSYEQRSGLCLETEHFPDAPNQPAFPSVVLKPGESYQSKTIYRFSVKD